MGQRCECMSIDIVDDVARSQCRLKCRSMSTDVGRCRPMSIDVVTSPKRHLRIQLGLCHSGASPERSTGGGGGGTICQLLPLYRQTVPQGGRAGGAPYRSMSSHGAAHGAAHVDPCRPMSTLGRPMSAPYRSMSPHVGPCRSMSTHVDPFRSMSSCL